MHVSSTSQSWGALLSFPLFALNPDARAPTAAVGPELSGLKCTVHPKPNSPNGHYHEHGMRRLFQKLFHTFMGFCVS
eukprot:3231798-Amphidinium_carterae.1